MSKNYPLQIKELKKSGQKIVMLTAYDFLLAQMLDNYVDIVLVGDSLGNVFAGMENTIPVTLDQMIYHTQAVKRGVSKALLVADMPFLSYQISLTEAKRNAGRLIKEGGAQAVKIEVDNQNFKVAKAILDMGIAVMGHIGFTPQTVYKLGGYKIQGKMNKEVDELLKTAQNLDKLGCFAIVLEMVPQEVAQLITKEISIPTIGIGAGPYCDGQVLVTEDILGWNNFKKTPKFVKKYADVNNIIERAVKTFTTEVKEKKFPDKGFSF
jgi:3-methyl-2-oxobutanoate hydroxymethyltransferase